MTTCTNIIDGFHADAFNLEALKNEGIIAMIHKATQGTTFRDSKYAQRRSAAKNLGFLWGTYHFATGADWEDQVQFFLDAAQPEPGELIAWDWEPPKHGVPMSIGHVRDSVELIHEKLGRFPVLYGGALLREQVGSSNDQVLKNCPLWYARYRGFPLGVPANTWPTYTLWQYTAGEIPNPSPNPPGPLKADGEFVDRNLYQGSDADLRNNWPFT